tara:strand:- start:76 stop:444 length:369 start_codon:yes stop_codon:yes gene_type:complete
MKNNSNPFSKAYFKEQSKKYIAIAKRSFKRIEKEYEKMYSNDGTPNDNYSDDIMCSYYDMENFLEFVDDKESFYSHGSCIVDLIKLDNEIEKGEKLLLKVTEKMNKYKKEKKDILINSLKVE